MALDVTQEYWAAAQTAAQGQGLSEDKIKKLRSAQLLRSFAAKTEFTRAAVDVANNLLTLRRYLRENQADYAQQGKLREAERDMVEEEVGAFVRTCSRNIDKLQSMLQLPPSPGKGQVISSDMVAHRQGMVLILSERLKSLTAAFDRLRSLRFQQLQQQEANRLRRLPQESPPSARKLAQRAQQHTRATPSPPSAASTASGAFPQRQPHTPQQAQQAGQQRGVRGVGPAGRSGWGAAAGGEPPQPPQLFQAPSPGIVLQQQQQQVQMDPENAALQQELISMGDQVQHVEKTVREIATLNQMFSTAIVHQSDQIAKLYTQAVDASHSIGQANVQLRKTIKTTAGARTYMLVFLLAATLGLLLMDRWSS